MVTWRLLLILTLITVSVAGAAEPSVGRLFGLPQTARTVDEIRYSGVTVLGDGGQPESVEPKKVRFTCGGREFLVATECNPFGGSRCRCRAVFYAFDSQAGLWRQVSDRPISGHITRAWLVEAEERIVVAGVDRRGRENRQLARFATDARSTRRYLRTK